MEMNQKVRQNRQKERNIYIGDFALPVCTEAAFSDCSV